VRLLLDAKTAMPTANVEGAVEGRVCLACYDKVLPRLPSRRSPDVQSIATSPIPSRVYSKAVNGGGGDGGDEEGEGAGEEGGRRVDGEGEGGWARRQLAGVFDSGRVGTLHDVICSYHHTVQLMTASMVSM
jgi:hypothetical protein